MNTLLLNKTDKKTVLLNSEQTEKFLQRIDLAIQSFDLVEIIKVIFDFKLTNAPDVRDFLDQAKIVTKVSDKYETIVKSVTPFKTKCIACKYGKTVNGYEIHSVVKDCENIRFTTRIALYFEIAGGELLDFGFCNGFLSGEEVSQLNNF